MAQLQFHALAIAIARGWSWARASGACLPASSVPVSSVPSMVRISVAHGATPELVDAVRRLVPQLSRSAQLPSLEDLARVVSSEATTLLVARDDSLGAEYIEGGDIEGGDIEGGDAAGMTRGPGAGAESPDWPVVGMLTLVTFRLPTGVRAWVEDVVVDSAARGRGVGEALVSAAVELAAARGSTTVDLTSRPSREAANRLYQKLGFDLRETNVYRYALAR